MQGKPKRVKRIRAAPASPKLRTKKNVSLRDEPGATIVASLAGDEATSGTMTGSESPTDVATHYNLEGAKPASEQGAMFDFLLRVRAGDPNTQVPPEALVSQVVQILPVLKLVAAGHPVPVQDLVLAERVVRAAHGREPWRAVLVQCFNMAGMLLPACADKALPLILDQLRTRGVGTPKPLLDPLSPIRHASAIKALRTMIAATGDRWLIAGPQERPGGRSKLVSAYAAASKLAHALGHHMPRNEFDAKRSSLAAEAAQRRKT